MRTGAAGYNWSSSVGGPAEEGAGVAKSTGAAEEDAGAAGPAAGA